MLNCYSVWTCIPRLASMDFRQLRTFSCVAELGSLSKASDTLRVAQPALSRQIKLLEHELRAELFTRNGRGMVLTDAGRLLLERAPPASSGRSTRSATISSLREGQPSGRVVLGLVPTVSCVLSARFARRSRRNLSRHLALHRRELQRPSVEWLHRGEMDLAHHLWAARRICTSPCRASAATHIVAVGPRGCGLARKKQVEIGWLLRQRLVLPSHSHGLRALIEHAAAKKKIKLDVQLEADSFRVLTSLVEEGLGLRAVAALVGAQRSRRGPAGSCRHLEAADTRTHRCLSDRSTRLDCHGCRHFAAARRNQRLPQGRPLGHPACLRCRGATHT